MPMPSGSPNFGQTPCSCQGGSNPLTNFLGQGQSLPQNSGTTMLPTTPQVDSPQAASSTVPSPNSPLTNNSEGSPVSSPQVQNLVNALPASRRQAAAQHFPNILAECQRQGVRDPDQISYILATATHESNAGQAMEEFASGQAYEGRSSLGNTQSGDGPRFKGRGYVQITGRRNYTDWSRRLGMDLVGNPQLAREPRVAARILVEGMMRGTFTGRSLPDYVGNGRTDFTNARRVVNGTDRASSIASIAQRLRSAMA